jgi:hypothetical protein
MASQQLIEFIEKGLNEGKRPAELQLHAIQELGASTADFNQALDRIMMGELSADPIPPVIAPSSPATAEETIVYKIETKPVPPHRVGFFNPLGWFKHHKALTVIVVLVGALAVGGYVVANVLMAPTINEVRALVYQRLQEMDTVEYEGSIEGEVTTDAVATLDSFLRYGPQKSYANRDRRIAGSKNTKVRLDFKGAADVRDSANPKSEIALTLTAEGFVIGLDTKTIGDDAFFKVRELPDLGMFDVSTFLNQWFKLDSEGLSAATGTSYVPSTDSDLSEAQKRRVMEIIINSNIFKFAEKIGNEDVDGKSAYHYRYTIDEVAFLNTIKALGHEIGNELEYTVEEERQFIEWIDAAGGEIWLAKKDLAPLKMTFDLAMRSVTGAPATGRLSLSLKFNKYNEEVAIEAPYPFKNLSEAFAETITAATPATRDEQRVVDIRALQSALDGYKEDYGTYPNTLDQLVSAKFALVGSIPNAPEPPDGKCTIEQNKYKYKSLISNKDYQLTFCLGAKTGEVAAGNRIAAPKGIR